MRFRPARGRRFRVVWCFHAIGLFATRYPQQVDCASQQLAIASDQMRRKLLEYA